jgi:hypothetical protein
MVPAAVIGADNNFISNGKSFFTEGTILSPKGRFFVD